MSAGLQLFEKQGGRLLTFATGIPNRGQGVLENRNSFKMYNTDQELNLFRHDNRHNFYSALGEQGVAQKVTFDLYLGVPSSTESIDLASLSKAVKTTGGDLVLYTKFNPFHHSEKLYFELFRNLTKPTGSDVKIKVRCSKGFSCTHYFGAFGKKESVEFQLSQIDADKTFCFQLRNDEKMPTERPVYVQIAVLYTD
jgi:hypothetical protein